MALFLSLSCFLPSCDLLRCFFFLIAAVGEWHLCACFEVKGRGDRLLVETTASSPAFLLPQQCKEDVGRSCTIAYYYFFFFFICRVCRGRLGKKKKEKVRQQREQATCKKEVEGGRNEKKRER